MAATTLRGALVTAVMVCLEWALWPGRDCCLFFVYSGRRDRIGEYLTGAVS
jgi:hypothetical protein